MIDSCRSLPLVDEELRKLAAAEAMRRILVESAKRKQSLKRGGQLQRVDLDEDRIEAPTRSIDLIALDEALNELAVHDPRKAELV